MRAAQFFGLFFVSAVVRATDEQVGPTSAGGKSLEDVYGTVEPVKDMDPWYARQMNRKARPDNYFNLRAADECDFPLEIVILQDATRSFEDDFEEMKNKQLPLMVEMLSEAHPGSTFSVVSFRDKPVWSLGEPRTDYCQKFELALTDNKTELTTVYDKMEALGGGDPSENQFGALVALTQSATVGWKNLEAAKLVVVVTDAPPHFEGDGLNGYGMATFSGKFNEAEAARQCLQEYYPSPQQVKEALAAREAYAAFLIFDGEWWNSLPSESWAWFNSYIGQPDAFVRPLSGSSVDFWDQLNKVIDDLAAIECGAGSTTTTPAVTTAEPELTVTNVGPTQVTSTEIVTETTTTIAPTTTVTTWVADSWTASPTTATTSVPETTTAAATTAAEDTTASLATDTEIVCPSMPPCVVEPCPPCEGECCHEVDIRLRKKPHHLHLDIYN